MMRSKKLLILSSLIISTFIAISLVSCDETTSNTSNSDTSSQTTSNTDTSDSDSWVSESSITITEPTTEMVVNRARVVSQIKYVTGFKTNYYIDEKVNFSTVLAYVAYEGIETLDVVPSSRLKFAYSSLTETEGQKTITVSYLGKSKNITIYVHEAPYIEISTIEKPLSIQKFEEHKNIDSDDKSGFLVKDTTYTVGTENEFSILPVIRASVIDDTGDLVANIILNKYEGDTTLSLFENNVKTPLTSELDTYATIDDHNAKIKFKEAAIGKQFEITLASAEDNTINSVPFTISVVKGYNVYTQDEISYMDTTTTWDAYQEANGLDTSYLANGLIFHSDIDLEPEYMPDSLFYKVGDTDLASDDPNYDSIVGTLRDGSSIYSRLKNTDPNQNSFGIYGNLFTINASNIPVVYETRLLETMSVSQLFLLGNASPSQANNLNSLVVKNISIIGNAPRNNEAGRGGVIAFKVRGTNTFDGDNIVANSCFLIILVENNCLDFDLNHTKGFDSYSTFLYNWGASDVVIKNSKFNQAGGPVIISDTVGKLTDTVHYTPNTKFIDCELNSWVAGTEGWFVATGSDTLVANLTVGSDAIKGYGSEGFTRELNTGDEIISQFNLVSVNKSGSAQSIEGTQCDGVTTISTTNAQNNIIDKNIIDYSDATISVYANNNSLNAAPLFVPDGDISKGCIVAPDLYTLTSVMAGHPEHPSAGQLNGDYLGTYLSNACAGVVFNITDLTNK